MRREGPRRGRAAWCNGPLLLGSLLALLLLALAGAGPFLAPADPAATLPLMHLEGGALRTPPYPPSDRFPLGSDWAGRDVLSRFLAGAPYTLAVALACALSRVGLGTVIGLLAWRSSSVPGAFTKLSGTVSGALPTLALGLGILKACAGLKLSAVASVVLYVAVLTLIGWPRVATLVAGRVQALAGEPFVEASVAAGCTQARLMRRHILPHLWGMLATVLALEAANAMLLLGQFGVFSAFIGGAVVVDKEPFVLYLPLAGEWGASLATARGSLRVAPWIPLVPAAGIFAAIAAFTLLAEGLKRLSRTGAA